LIPGDFQFSKPSRQGMAKLAILGTFAFLVMALVVVLLVFVISAWLGRPVIFGYSEGPDQPIAFPHTKHVEELGLDCTYCHRNVTHGESASIPAVGLCMTCHQNIGDEIPAVEKLRLAFEENRPIDWVRVHRLPDHVQFVHSAHVKRFSGTKTVVEIIEDPENQIRLKDAQRINSQIKLNQTMQVTVSDVCVICHGEVGKMEKVKQIRPLKMGDCVDCHKNNAAPTDCSTCHF